jgi:hypothetical protein
MSKLASLTLIVAITGSVVSCGGGSMDPTPPAIADGSLRIVDAGPGTAATPLPPRTRVLAAAPIPDATQLFDWAESIFPAWFPSHQPNLVWTSYVYRFYPETGNYLAVDSGVFVRVLGASFGPDIITVGTLRDFTCFVTPLICRAPTASAGAEITVLAGSMVSLDGRASSDPNGSSLTYMWSMASKPAGSGAVLTAADTAQPTFIADIAGTYQLQLVVTNGFVPSAAANVLVTAAPYSIPVGYY